MNQVLILGLGESGLAMARWAHACQQETQSTSDTSNILRVADTRSDASNPPPGLAQLRAEIPHAHICLQTFSADLLEGITRIGISPGLSPLDTNVAALLAAAQAKNIPVESEVDWFADALTKLQIEKKYSPKVIAITGTNGKTTVTALTAHLCARAGFLAVACGNISPSVLEALAQAIHTQSLPDVWVLELSSFQLFYTQRLQAHAATILNISQDHLDWHGSMEHYVAAKLRIFSHNTIRIVNRDDALTAHCVNARSISFGVDEPTFSGNFGLKREGAAHDQHGMVWLAQAVPDEDGARKTKKNEIATCSTKLLMPADALPIRGLHNASNALAALALCQAMGQTMGVRLADLLHGLRTYQGEPHRVQHLATWREVAFYDDSKGTNVGATVAALQGLGALQRPQQKIILIAGGVGKGQNFAPLAEPIAAYCRCVILMGQAQAAMRATLAAANNAVEVVSAHSMQEAVDIACAAMQAGDAVLLSPACASFDMFKNYAHRAQAFSDCVRASMLDAGEVMV